MSVSFFRRLALAVLCLAAPLALGRAARAEVPVYGYKVVRAYPHDPGAFTEGLFYLNGYLYESTGLEGRSTIRKEELETGKVLQERSISPAYFGEGIVAWKDRLIELTWRSQIGFIYNLKTFAPEGSFRYPGEGWALTRDAKRLIMTDGTSDIRFLDPATLKETGRIHVTADGVPVRNLNEIEAVKGRLYANLWETSQIACIDPATGKVLYFVDFGPLVLLSAGPNNQDSVLNGIAYDDKNDRLFVTGKLWSQLYEIKIVPPAGAR